MASSEDPNRTRPCLDGYAGSLIDLTSMVQDAIDLCGHEIFAFLFYIITSFMKPN